MYDSSHQLFVLNFRGVCFTFPIDSKFEVNHANLYFFPKLFRYSLNILKYIKHPAQPKMPQTGSKFAGFLQLVYKSVKIRLVAINLQHTVSVDNL